MMLLAGVVLTIVVTLFLKPMMLAFGATDNVLDYALTYTGITSLGFPFLIVTTGGSNLIRADGSPKYSMICTLAGAIINTILDPLFIFTFEDVYKRQVCSTPLFKIGEEFVRRELVFIPAKLKVVEIYSFNYSCPE